MKTQRLREICWVKMFVSKEQNLHYDQMVELLPSHWLKHASDGKTAHEEEMTMIEL